MNRRNRQSRADVALLDGAVAIPRLSVGALWIGARNCRKHSDSGVDKPLREDASIVTTALAIVGRKSSDTRFSHTVISGAGQGCVRLKATLKDGDGDAYPAHDYLDERLLTGIVTGGIRLRGEFVPLPAVGSDYRVAVML